MAWCPLPQNNRQWLASTQTVSFFNIKQSKSLLICSRDRKNTRRIVAFSQNLAQALLQNGYLSWKRSVDVGVDITWFGCRGWVSEKNIYIQLVLRCQGSSTTFRDLSKSFQRVLRSILTPQRRGASKCFWREECRKRWSNPFSRGYHFIVWIASIFASASIPNSLSRIVEPIQSLFRGLQGLYVDPKALTRLLWHRNVEPQKTLGIRLCQLFIISLYRSFQEAVGRWHPLLVGYTVLLLLAGYLAGWNDSKPSGYKIAQFQEGTGKGTEGVVCVGEDDRVHHGKSGANRQKIQKRNIRILN